MGGTPKSSILVGFSIINQPFVDSSMTMETPFFYHSIHDLKDYIDHVYIIDIGLILQIVYRMMYIYIYPHLYIYI